MGKINAGAGGERDDVLACGGGGAAVNAMNSLDGAAKLTAMVIRLESERLTAMVIRLESERDAAIARAERAEAAANDCRRVVAAIPWRSLASIYVHPGAVLDADVDALGVFLGAYIPTGFYSSKSESGE